MLGTGPDKMRVIEQLSAMGKAVSDVISDESKRMALLKELAEDFEVALIPMDSFSKQISAAIGIRNLAP